MRIRKKISQYLFLLFNDPAKSFTMFARQGEDGTWTQSFLKHTEQYGRIRLWSLTGGVAILSAVFLTVVIVKNIFPSSPYSFAATYSWLIPTDPGYSWLDHLSLTSDSDIPDENPDNISVSAQGLRLTQKATKFFQTNWVGGPNQSLFSDATKFFESSNIDYSVTGEIKLTIPTQSFSETFGSKTYADSTNTTAIWEKSREGGRARVSVTNEEMQYRGGGNSIDVTGKSATAYEIWAVVDRFILKSSASGWDNPDFVLTNSTQGTFTAITSADANRKWAGTNSGFLFQTTSGNNWSLSVTGVGAAILPCGSSVGINDIVAVVETDCGSSCDVWAACNDGGAAVSTDSGATWTKNSVGAFSTVQTIAPVSGTTAYAVSGNSTQVKGTTNGGTTWTDSDTGSSNNLNGIFALSSTAVIAVGENGTIRVFDGTSWSSKTSGVTTSLKATHASSATAIWVVGAGGTILQSTNGGTTWNNRTNATVTTNTLRSIHVFGALTAAIVGENGDVIEATNSGSTLTEQFPNTNTIANTATSFASRLRGWVVGQSGKILFTSAGGAGSSWSSQTSPCAGNATINDISSVRNSSCATNCVAWIACSDGKVGMTSNSGSTWSLVTNPPSEIAAIAGQSSGIAFGADASGNVFQYDGTDDSPAWSSNKNPTVNRIRQMSSVSDGANSVVWGVGDANTIIVSTNGTTFSTQTSPLNGGSMLTDIDSIDASNAVISASGGGMIVTSNGGGTWSSVSVSETNENFLSIGALSNQVIVMTEGTPSLPGNKIFVSSNGGTNWTSITFPGNLIDVEYLDEKTALFVGGTNGLLVERFGEFQSSSLAQSSAVDTVSGTITRALLTAQETLNSQTISYQMSANGGTNWETVSSGSQHSFSNTGSDLRWRASINQSNPTSYPPAYLTGVSIQYLAGYAENGTMTSSIFDFGTKNTEFREATGPSSTSGQTVAVRIRTGKQPDLSDAKKSNITDCDVIQMGFDISNNNCVRDGDRYVQYHFGLATDNSQATPTVQDITINALIFGSIFHDYDAIDTAVWSSFEPTEKLQSGNMNAKYRFKTAAARNQLAEAPWSSFFDSLPMNFSSLGASRWLRVESRIETIDPNGNDDGVIESEKISRQQNGSPEFNPNFHSGRPVIHQNDDGTVTITSQVRDPDTNSGKSNNKGKVDASIWFDRGLRLVLPLSETGTTATMNDVESLTAPGFLLLDDEIISYSGINVQTKELTGLSRAQRSTASANHGTVATHITAWAKAENATGDGLIKVGQEEYSDINATWIASKDFGGAFQQSMAIRLVANDREGVFNIASQTSEGFGLDTKPPIVHDQSLIVNASSKKTNDEKVTVILDASDESSIFVALSNDGKIFGTNQDENGTVTNPGTFKSLKETMSWKLAKGNDGERIVYGQIKDSYGNMSSIVSDSIELDTQATNIVKNFTVSDASQSSVKRFWVLLGWNALSKEKNPDFDHYVIETSLNGKKFTPKASLTDIQRDHYLDQDLSGNTMAYYRIFGVDDIGNQSDSSTIVSIVPGSADTVPPKFDSKPEVISITGQSAVITWKTNEISSGCVEWGETSEFGRVECARESSADHEVKLEDLKSNFTYYYRAISKDPAGNEAASESFTFQTAVSSKDETRPLILLPGPTVKPSFKDAIIAWETNEPSDSFVEFGLTKTYGSTQGSVKLTKKHEVRIIGLTPLAQYHARVRTKDSSNNETISDDFTFLTKASEGIVAPPSISNIQIIAPDDPYRSAIIRWKTDTHATSQVMYGVTINQLDRESSLDSTLNLDHVVTLSDLSEGTTYFFTVRSTDEFGQLSKSEVQSFTTTKMAKTPEIIDVSIFDITMNGFTVSWTTSLTTTSVVDIGIDQNYGRTIVDETAVTSANHVVRMQDLLEGTTYHVRLSGTSPEGKPVVSDDYVFTTLAHPKIFDLKVINITASTATVTWKTNERTDSIVSVGIEGEGRSEQGFSDLTVDHSVTVTGLRPQMTYSVIAKSRDSLGNVAESEPLTIQTPQDSIAPVISNVSSDVSISGSKERGETKLIISWKTNEPATSQVHFSKGLILPRNREGSAMYPETTKLDDQLTTNHVVVLNADPAATYHFRVVSTDGSLNTSYSDDYTTLTPTQRITILERVVSTLTNTFSWMSRIQELFNLP